MFFSLLCYFFIPMVQEARHEIFDFGFFMNQFPQSIPLEPFKIFTKMRGDYSQFCVYCRCQRHRQQAIHRCERHRQQILADVVVTGD
jgi:hypothetical protein